jgi:hypothetical protein
VVDEFIEFLKLPREDFDLCKPLEWWHGCQSQFPNLYRLACDIFSIPGKIWTKKIDFVWLILFAGSAVAVERVFSGGRDTISLRRASLVPSPISVLMLVKQCLRLVCHAHEAGNS